MSLLPNEARQFIRSASHSEESASNPSSTINAHNRSSSMGTTNVHRDRGSGGGSLATIESSVTRLLVSTKHLLESLTLWARQESDDKFVSDAYVKLGNDFRSASKAFTGAGIDVSDLGNVPQQLREILEAALGEAPSQENLDRFLPSIRNIIVTLLQNLKQKQSRAREMAISNNTNTTTSHQRKSSLDFKLSSGKRRLESLRPHDAGGSGHTSASSIASASSNENSLSSHRLPGGGAASAAPTGTRSSPAKSPISASKPVPEINVGPTAVNANAAEALSQLQKGNFLQRRASKRYSAYQYAKLSNHTPSEIAETSFEDDYTNASTYLQSPKLEISHPQAQPENTSLDSCVIFLKIHNKVKKVVIRLPVSFAALRLLFVERFAYSPGTSTFPEIYILDPSTGIAYELEEHLLEVDVKDGSLLSLNIPDPLQEAIKSLDGKIEGLALKFESVGKDIVVKLNDSINRINITPQPQPVSSDVHASSTTLENNKNLKLVLLFSEHSKELRSIEQDIKVVRQLQNSNSDSMKNSLLDIIESVKKLKDQGLAASKSSNRAYIETCYAKLSDTSDNLLTRVDDLQDLMDAMRKDVAQRGVRVSERQLTSTEKEIDQVRLMLDKMNSYILDEKDNWKRIWERELDKVCEEQQFFNLQEALTNDLDDDIKKIEETFDLIQRCSIEQNKVGTSKRKPFLTYIPEPGEVIEDIKEAVLEEVTALRPNHQSRVQAIEKAEKLREKQKELSSLSEFQEELGTFVGDSRLKKSGGIDELERVRQMKDSENLKSSFGVI
ncbi:Bud site selection protein 6 [Scheffersomyces spartinae]|uniref:Bud site selection protein 6 n=1 Tax=Scheffersomyces spartinae TaxID=45513 RepID=A0A9P8AHY2_9ASCO|nr:Bud site selection protein 6 [Scheffersomyces spartinae]KAG7193843.1 Bud site selection protein 6 [Scheffersomyces spartinae]